MNGISMPETILFEVPLQLTFPQLVPLRDNRLHWDVLRLWNIFPEGLFFHPP